MKIDEGDLPEELKKNVFLTTIDNVYNWGRVRSMWPMAFGLACCAIEFMAMMASRFDLSRFGMEIIRASPRQADLMFVSGTVTKKMVPNIVRLYNQMAEPKYVLAMGACATSGGPFKEGYNVVSGIDKFIPVDVYVPGCPPTPEAILYGVLKVHEKVFGQSISTAPWYRKDQLNEPLPMPVLGPDLYNLKDYEALKKIAAAEADTETSGQGDAVDKVDRTALCLILSTCLPRLPGWRTTMTDATTQTGLPFNDVVPGAVLESTKNGLVVAAERLLELARYLRDQRGLRLPLDGHQRGLAAVFRGGVLPLRRGAAEGSAGPQGSSDRQGQPVVPSLISVWPGADLRSAKSTT